ncbi:MAG: ATPase, partial [Candidatus Aenigmarchaeota archaeon]|nr:ATPase [Candidatus Aenigmarchaeota archaeon]
MERISTGIAGFDDKLEGGYVPGSVILIAGKAGTCKTTVSASFIYDGVQKNEPGVYITTEEMEDGIKNDLMSVFGWD